MFGAPVTVPFASAPMVTAPTVYAAPAPTVTQTVAPPLYGGFARAPGVVGTIASAPVATQTLVAAPPVSTIAASPVVTGTLAAPKVNAGGYAETKTSIAYDIIMEEVKQVVNEPVFESVTEMVPRIVTKQVEVPAQAYGVHHQQHSKKVKDDHPHKFRVTVLKLETHHGDDKADWYVKVCYHGEEKKTSIKKNAGHGTTHWHDHHTFEFDIHHGHELKFEIEDKDKHESDHLGKCDLGHKPEHYPHGPHHHHDMDIKKHGHDHHRGKLTVKLELIYGHHHVHEDSMSRSMPSTQIMTIQEQIMEPVVRQVARGQVAREVVSMVPAKKVPREIVWGKRIIEETVYEPIVESVTQMVPRTITKQVEVPSQAFESRTVMHREQHTKKVKDDHPHKFKVTVLKLETHDGDSKADWYVKVCYHGEEKKTSIKKNAGHGTTHWHDHHTFEFDIHHGHELKFKIEDKDKHESDHLGECDLGHKPEHYPHGPHHHHDMDIKKHGHDHHRGKLTVKLELIYGHHHVHEHSEAPRSIQESVARTEIVAIQEQIMEPVVMQVVVGQTSKVVTKEVWEVVSQKSLGGGEVLLRK
jgi:hypothetical protein